jgi:hypothetical protein
MAPEITAQILALVPHPFLFFLRLLALTVILKVLLSLGHVLLSSIFTHAFTTSFAPVSP